MKNLYTDISILQSVPASNMNRDDVGSPKTVIYGGVIRSRVSSQSWKRAIREGFNNNDKLGNLVGIRTKKVVTLVAKRMVELDSAYDFEKAKETVAKVLNGSKIKVDKNNETGALFMLSHGQVDRLANYILENGDNFDKKEVKKVITSDKSLDMALFGRMVADDPELNVDASAQVAHAISTHEIVPEYDYYTALDDEQSKDSQGAAMLGTIEFNSSTLYRYANVNVNDLAHNLESQNAIKGVKEFLRSFILSMPSGKQNSFANKTLPSYVMVTIRKDTPINLVSAFEEPVKSHGGYMKESIKRLESEYTNTLKFAEKPIANFVLSLDKIDHSVSFDAEDTENIDSLLDKVASVLEKAVQDESHND
ncbi:type I-E CRISPR-associated protein Cas7/Cse4/CasC [Ligilactobacillus ruminis]|uniref:type I-E CRISPR-associated protein Cas7/Cse4/CasC n=1 Tax=Ligilactobacillus ruminis TaxID=1623 RepID=UPI003CFEA883